MRNRLALLLPVILLWLFLGPIYLARTPAFGCFDDCFNYMGGYFLNAGKHLYSNIFYNHQPILAYLSAVIQKFGTPESMYVLVWQHRLAVIGWSIAWNILLILRFGWVGMGFAFLYETTKGYLFGERFLAESLIVYPIVYVLGLVWEGFRGKKLHQLELIASAAAIWFVIFSREPYMLLALILFGSILWVNKKNAKLAIGIFLGLSLLIVIANSPSDYFFNLITVNTSSVASAEIHGSGLTGVINSFVYPVLVFFGGNWNLFRQIEVGIAIFFWLGLFSVRHRISKKLFLFIVLTLGLANIRPVEPGAIYYAAFHHLVGYGLFLFVTLLIMQKAKKVVLWVGFAVLVTFAIFNPQSYLRDRVDRNAEFTQNYGQYYVPGEVVRLLSEPSDTLFLDGLDDLIYWQAKRYSPYQYSWYTSVMHEFALYTDARKKMFTENPPDFYYGKCSDDQLVSVLPDNILNDYLRFYWQGRATCLFVHKAMYVQIPKERLEAVQRQFEYSVR